MKIVFSVLHYKNFDITDQCIQSILKLIKIDEITTQILIVDNPVLNNDSGMKLKEKYSEHPEVFILTNKENLGFTGGNNAGFYYAKNKLNADIIVVMNNDMIFEDEKFIIKLYQLQDKTYDILSPNVITKDNVHQNPFRKNKLSKIETIKIFLKILLLNISYKNKILSKIHINKISKKEIVEPSWNKEAYGIVPHGSIIIYNDRYITNEDLAFIPGPFLYAEEDLLMWYIEKKGYKTYYSPKLKIKHLESVSTGDMSNDCIKNYKKIFKYKLLSVWILLKKEFSFKAIL